MKSTLLTLVLAASAMAQVYPSAVATDANLPRAVNSATTTLATSINNSTTTVVLTSGAKFTSNSVLTIGTERILCGTLTTNTCTGATRGYDGSSAASHSSGATVSGYFVAANINKALDEIKAIETFLGSNGSGKLGSALKIFSAHDTGGDDTYVTATPVSGSCPSALTDLHVILTVDTANTGAASLDFCGLGALAIKKNDGSSTPADGDLASGGSYLLQYVDAATDYWRMPSGGGGGGTGDVAGPSSATDNCAPLYDGTTGKLLKDSTICADATKNGSISLPGVTSGELAFTVANIAGTATTLVMPTDTSTATTGYVMKLGGTTTCPTLMPAALPSTCRSVSWAADNNSGTVTVSGTPTAGNCVSWAGVSSIQDSGDVCGGGSGGGGLSGSSSLDFSSLGDGQNADLTFSLSGLSAGTTVSLGIPSTFPDGLEAIALGSATDTVKIRVFNRSGAAVDLTALTFSVTHPTAITASASIDFGSLRDGECSTNTFTLTGVAAGGRISPGLPAAFASGLSARFHASAADTIKVQVCNDTGATFDPASGTFSAAIL